MRRIKNRGALVVSTPNNILGCMIEKKIVNYLCHCDGAAADFVVYGKDNNKLALVSSDGWLITYDLGKFKTSNFSGLPVMFLGKKRLPLHPKHSKKMRKLDAEYREFDYTLAVCPNHKYFAVHSKSMNSNTACIEIYEFSCGNFIQKDAIDYQYKDPFNLSITCMDFYGYLGDKLVLCTLSGGFKQKMLSYVFDLNIGKLGKLDLFDITDNCYFGNCYKMIKKDGMISVCDGKGNINHVSFSRRRGSQDWSFCE